MSLLATCIEQIYDNQAHKYMYVINITNGKKHVVHLLFLDLPEKLIYKGYIPIDSTWDEELANKSSPKYQQKAENVSHMVNLRRLLLLSLFNDSIEPYPSIFLK